MGHGPGGPPVFNFNQVLAIVRQMGAMGCLEVIMEENGVTRIFPSRKGDES